MDIDKVKEFLGTDEGKMIVAELGYESPDSVKGLKENKDKILKDNVTLKQKVRDLEEFKSNLIGKLKYHDGVLDESGEINYTEIDRRLTSKKSGGGTEFDELTFKRTKDELDNLKRKYDSDLAEREGYISNLLIDNQLQELMAKSGDFPAQGIKVLLPSLKAMSGAKVVITDNGERQALTPDGKSLAEWFNGVKETDEIKAFRIARPNTGGGASSGSGSSANKPFKQMTLTERAELKVRDPKLYEQMKAQ